MKSGTSLDSRLRGNDGVGGSEEAGNDRHVLHVAAAFDADFVEGVANPAKAVGLDGLHLRRGQSQLAIQTRTDSGPLFAPLFGPFAPESLP